MASSFSERRTDRTASCSAVLTGTSWSVAKPDARRSLHHRTCDPARLRWEIDHTELAPKGSAAGAVEAELRAALRTCGSRSWSPDVAVRLELIRTSREYVNSEGTEEEYVADHWALSVTRQRGTSTRRVVDHPDDLTVLFDHVHAHSLPTERDVVSLPAEPLPVLLTPHVAGVLVHELVGHGLEEGDIRPGEPLMPAGLRVVAMPPASRGADDEGVPAEALTVVEDGIVRLAIRDRASTVDLDERPTGNAWAGPHAMVPRARLPLLDTQVRDHHDEDIPARFIRCSAVGGACYFDRRAVLDVVRPELVTPRGEVPLADARVIIGSRALREAVALTTEHRFEPEPAGICVKHGDSLLSKVLSPALLLREAQVIWAAK